MAMWSNRLKQRLARGETVFGPILQEFYSPNLVEFLGYVGFDFVVIDGEHAGVTSSGAQDLFRAAEVSGLTPLVRVPRVEPATILSYLDAGAHGIMAPHVNTSEEAELLMRAVKYPPLGVRGAASGSRIAHFGLTQTPPEHVANSNAQTMAIPMLEEVDAYRHLPAMLHIEGLDVFQLGPGDLSLTMGHYADPQHPQVQALLNLAIQQIKGAGKVVGGVARTAGQARELASQGVQFIMCSFAGLAAAACREYLRQARGG